MGTFLQNNTAHVFYSKVFSSCMRNRFLILTITKFEKIWDYRDFKNLKINTKHHQRACHQTIKFELFQTTFCIISKATLATKSCWLHKKIIIIINLQQLFFLTLMDFFQSEWYIFTLQSYSSCMRNRFLILTIIDFEKLWDWRDLKHLKINTKHHQWTHHQTIEIELFQRPLVGW